MQKVSAVQDDSSHWYVIPSEMVSEFYKMGEFEDNYEQFERKFGHYRTGGDLNSVQLYAELNGF